MIHAARLLGLVSACAAPLVAGALLEPASAQGDTCKADIVTAAGRAKLRFFAKNQEKELEGDGAAKRDAIANWERQAGNSFGKEWKNWSKATDTSFDCTPIKGKIAGTFIRCTVSGRPCLTADAPRPGEAEIVEEEKGPRGKARNKNARVIEKDRIIRYEDTVYEREMARQRYLETERKRIETAAYEREMARQKYLAEQRRREEVAAWERETARQRYLAEQQKWLDRAYDRGPYWSDY